MPALLMADEDTFEHLYREWESNGYDTAEMRAAQHEIAAIPVGDPTPLPGVLVREETLVVPALTPVHHGLYENPGGSLWRPYKGLPGRHFSVAQLRTQVARLRMWVAGLTMCFISALVVAVVKW